MLKISNVRAALVAGVLTLAPVAAAAQGFLYDCTMTGTKQAKGWISDRIVLVLPGDGTVTIADAVTLHFNKGPLPGKILRENAKRLVVRWTVENATADSGRSFSKFDYRASVGKANGQIEVTGIPRHFDTGVRGSGTCKRRTK